jgi:rRNA maturation protein Nop10
MLGSSWEPVQNSAGIVSFDIPEDDARWEKVAAVCVNFKVFDTVRTQFSESELNDARFLATFACGHHGYPEPRDGHGYLAATFDLRDRCPACGLGKKQVAPFRIKNIKALGKRAILQLNWVFDEYFVTPDVWKSVFEPLGVGYREVLLHSTGSVLDSVVQLDICDSADVNVYDIPFKTCPACGRKKHQREPNGLYPVPVMPRAAIFKSKQWFGIGVPLVLVSHALYQRIGDAGLRGVTFQACAGPPLGGSK